MKDLLAVINEYATPYWGINSVEIMDNDVHMVRFVWGDSYAYVYDCQDGTYMCMCPDGSWQAPNLAGVHHFFTGE